MFQATDVSAARGKSSEQARRAAMHVRRSNIDNGLARAIEYVLSGKWSSNGAGQIGTDR
jgi:hydroxymethylpyrimidine pyrophosphatase-like HAD family hydrolase